jgi:glycosyltransferase involved in cell wall biosynthesis
MKVLLAAGVFYPDVGGPAIHVKKIAERFSAEGLDVLIIAYGDDPAHTPFSFRVKRVSRRFPKPLQWVFYTLLMLWHAPESKVIYAFDPTAAGVPARIAATIFHKPFLIRVGGDPIWEREAEMGRRLMPIDKYYELGLYKKDKPGLYKIIRGLLQGSDKVVVYNQNFRDFYVRYFSVSPEKFLIIKNPATRRAQAVSEELPAEPTILFAGRFVAYKNLPMVVKAWKEVGIGKLMLIGSGPEEPRLRQEGVTILPSVPQDQLFEYIKKSAVCIGPALSEFNPNFILEALSFGKPVLLSRGNGLSVELPEEFLFNPLDQQEFEQKLRSILQPKNYKKAVQMVNNLPLNQGWEEVTDAHLHLIKKWL